MIVQNGVPDTVVRQDWGKSLILTAEVKLVEPLVALVKFCFFIKEIDYICNKLSVIILLKGVG